MSEWHYGVRQGEDWVNGWWPAEVARTLLPVVELGTRVLGVSLERRKSLERQSPPRISAQSYTRGRSHQGLR